ncbi:DNA polymerase epsilon, catalytic subunit a, putative [Theileria equi strain WA]|uniref:DNA polymerase epsilon catalytic subunit n=1 Tax=Theileria equi strain WA TaxID=1537102 RepID=L0B353_THEEQ|nr:DNA polymerase epsilon, catalytic subunit a, putative [Theileria equi strain WA]AFZ81656.1 DNA polymerase epsilon, catalytic subunit a, putative [Theileria equi strain WA]|eukprot:XP_004831322.1 DNA polymerase epsilon, catalytic subunit a, putative [Theileria equi strain WA]
MAGYSRSLSWNSNGKRQGFLYNVVPTTVKGSIELNRRVSSDNKPEEHLNLSNFGSSNEFGSGHLIGLKSALSLYFVSDDGSEWHTSIIYAPYFYVSITDPGCVDVTLQFLYNKFKSHSIGPVLLEPCTKIDLSLPNHLEKIDPTDGTSKHNIGQLIRIYFSTVDQLERGRDLIVGLKRQFEKEIALHTDLSSTLGYDPANESSVKSAFSESFLYNDSENSLNLAYQDSWKYKNEHFEGKKYNTNPSISNIGDIYEYDIKYVNRVCIDLSIRCGTWYDVERNGYDVKLRQLSITSVAPLNVLAWDIECYKAPLKFPDMETDEIILISVVFNGQGYLIVNRSVVAKDILEFSYQPSEDMIGTASFKIFNEANELDLLQRFFNLILALKPHIVVTYNGDNFDFPYVSRRSEINGIPIGKVLGFFHSSSGLFTNSAILNMDCYKWVERDSYLPFGSRTLKQVCKLMLKYNPVEIDPEDMVHFARSAPQKLAVYSVSDAVATYFLFIKFIHNFIFALCSIVPLPPNDTLRQGTGTLCENLLMAEAYSNNILFPNKHTQKSIRYYTNPDTDKQHLIYENSYIGGRVESLRCGIFRDDQAEQFKLNSASYQMLIDTIEETLLYWAKNNIDGDIETLICDEDVSSSNIDFAPSEKLCRIFSKFENFNEVYRDLYTRLCTLRDNPMIKTFPRIYHLDVGAMYPNIIISQRLQPTAIVTEDFCRKCSYYKESLLCQKKMNWKQRLEISPIDKSQILILAQDLKGRAYKSTNIQYNNTIKDEDTESEEDEIETISKSTNRTWYQLNERERGAELQKAVKLYSQKIFKKSKINREIDVESIICQRENPFYVQTVSTFRDRRYTYKHLKKEGENELKQLLRELNPDSVKIKQAREKILINDSLQLAYKCILNSFYGYVKRAGSRWYSMEMGAIVTFAGASIIDSARKLIENVGIPIELDTDGIWCMLPDIFPAVLDLKFGSGESAGKIKELEYMTTVLNMLIAKKWTNDQYLELEEIGKYRTTRRNEIAFELDGPWHAMFLPASEKSEELLKKRYVVYNHQNKIVELKGFEIKRRGEMRMIQLFQEDIFPQYLLGKTKDDAYKNAAKVALCYRQILDSRAAGLVEDDMFDLLVAKKTVKKPVNQQPALKCFGTTSAKRLAELFKNDTYLNDGNLSMSFLLASHPEDAPRTSRAIPIQTFKVDSAVRSQFLSKWLKIQLSKANVSSARDILDWDYYKEKLDTQILKLICLPAIMQGVTNPIPHIDMPKWIKKKQSLAENKQRQISSFFAKGEISNQKTSKIDLLKVEHPKKININWIQNLKFKWLKTSQNFKRNRKKTQYINFQLHKELKELLPEIRTRTIDFDDLYALFSETWHVYNFSVDEKNPGIINCYLSVHNKPLFINVRIEAWRKFYINNKKKWDVVPNENVIVREINDQYLLPRGAVQAHLIELEMKENYFLDYIKNSLNSIFHKTVLGVYETQIPIFFDFLTRMGNMVKTGSEDVNTVMNNNMEFQSNKLSPITTMHSGDLKYFSDVEILYVHIFHGTDYETKRHNKFFASIYSKEENMVNKVFIGGSMLLKKYADEAFTNISEPILSKHRAKWIEHKSIKHDDYVNPAIFPDCFGAIYDAEFDISDIPITSFRNSLRKLDKFLYNLRPAVSKRKYVVYVYSTLQTSELGDWSKGLYYPVHFEVSNSHQIISNTFLKQCFDSSIDLLYQHLCLIEEKLAISQISSIPFGFILSLNKPNMFKCVFDVMYARVLRSSSVILWGTRDLSSDLGVPHFSNKTHSDFDIITNENLNFTVPGIYRGYGVNITFNQSLMYNAIVLESKLDGNIQFNNPNTLKSDEYKCYDEVQLDSNSHLSLFHPLAFRALGATLENLMKLTNLVFQKVDYGTFQNIVNICSFLKPWLSDAGAILYDPSLYAMAVMSTQKYLKKLIYHFSSVHKLRVIYVTSTSIVVDTNTTSITKGRNKIYEALEDLSSAHSKFRNIPFHVEEEFVAMAQLDNTYYIRYKDYIDASKSNCSENLKVLEYLPCAVEMFIRYFIKTIALDPLWQSLKKFYMNETTDDKQIGQQEPLELINTDSLDIQEQIEKHIIHDWHQPGTHFSKLYDILSDNDSFLRMFDRSGSHSQLNFPALPGSIFEGKDCWKLETVKLLIYIIQIDRALDWKNNILNTSFEEKIHQLFMLTGESEYVSKNWNPPMRKMEINSITCEKCFMVSDIDVVSGLTYIDDNDGNISYQWPCQICSDPLNSKQIEVKIIQYLENIFHAQQAQDSICPDCKTVKTVYRRRGCKCGKKYVPRLSKSHWM